MFRLNSADGNFEANNIETLRAEAEEARTEKEVEEE